MARPRKRKGKLKIRQSLRLTTAKNNAGNIGHPAALNNAGNIRVSIKRKT